MEVDDSDSPTHTLEHFVELAQVEQMIDDLKTEHDKTFEKSYETFSGILSRYQEQPHLLNPHLPLLIEKLLNFIRQKDVPATLFHAAFKYLYQFAKVRTYKILLKFLPHEITDLDFVLSALEQQNIAETSTWETRYMLIVWLSILVLNPFELARFDAFTAATAAGGGDGENKPLSKMDRIFNICKLNTNNRDTCSNVAAFLTAKFLIRIDIKDKYLPKYLEWIIESNEPVQFGTLAAISNILKHGKREDLLIHAPKLLTWLISCDFKSGNDFLRNKFFVKIIQRLGLVFLKPRLAKWRYQRGSRSLTAKLAAQSTKDDIEFTHDEITAEENEDEIEVPSEIEEIIEELLQAMRNPSSDIRWSAAKGIGRITIRLPREFGDEVVGSVVEILSPLEPHEAWHGACLSIAELAKRGLLLPHRLQIMVPLLLQALVYDELQGYMSVGQHIRDAACYMCWAFARAYEPSVLKEFVNQIAAGLLITTVFDREINCRRAASAAFQESVGRLRTFPHGIDILTKADFFSVGLRTHSYLEISDYIAQYSEYSRPLIDHLVDRKVNHWDPAIREITSKTLHKLTAREPDYMVNEVLPKLFSKTSSIDINQRHGTVLAIGEIVAKLKFLENESVDQKVFINDSLTEQLNGLVRTFQDRDQFRGLSGEIMFQCCCDFIKNCSVSKVAASPECLDSWQLVIDSSLTKNSAPIRDAAVAALSELCKSYYNDSNETGKNIRLLEKYLTASSEESWEFVRMGYVSAIGALPKTILKLKLKDVLLTLIAHSLTPADRKLFLNDQTVDTANVANWAEARKESIRALTNVVQSIGFDEIIDLELLENGKAIDIIFDSLLLALNEYTIDNRGDIGAWVRESAMNALYKLTVTIPPEYLDEKKVNAVVNGFLQQAVEKIDRTRALAGKLFCKTIYNDPPIPFIKHHDFIKTVFPEDFSSILWLYPAHTFPLFCTLLEQPEYTERLLIGLIASIGQLTESLVKYSSESFITFLHEHPQHQNRICAAIIDVFNKNVLNERISYPLLNFLNILIGSGVIDDIILDASSMFSSEVYRLTKLEIKGHKKLYKLVSSINVFCQLIQVPDLSSKVLSTLSIFLGLPHVHVRKTTATKLYEALILHADACGIPEENLDEIMNCLSEVDWGQDITKIRQIRNELCLKLNIKPPVTAASGAK